MGQKGEGFGLLSSETRRPCDLRLMILDDQCRRSFRTDEQAQILPLL